MNKDSFIVGFASGVGTMVFYLGFSTGALIPVYLVAGPLLIVSAFLVWRLKGKNSTEVRRDE